MKKAISFLLVLTSLSAFLLGISSFADERVGINCQITWSSGKQGVFEDGGVYAQGETPTVTTYIPTFESETYPDYFYVFVGWYFKAEATEQEFNEYKTSHPEAKGMTLKNYRNKLSLEFMDKYYADPVLEPGETLPEFIPQPVYKDTVYYSYYNKLPKKYSMNSDNAINIGDVTALLDYLADDSGKIEGYGTGDIDGDGFPTIRDVTCLLDYLSTGIIV